MCAHSLSCVQLCVTLLARLPCPWDSPGKDTAVGCCHFLLQGIFPTQESNVRLLCLIHWRWIVYPPSYWAAFTMGQFSSVAQSCASLWDPVDRSTPGLPVHHQLPELARTHVRWVGDAVSARKFLWAYLFPSPHPAASQLWLEIGHSVRTDSTGRGKHYKFTFSSTPLEESLLNSCEPSVA